MPKNNKLKAVLLIGSEQEEEYAILSKVYNKEGYLIIGNGKDPINNKDLHGLKGRIDHNTRIDIIAHGNSDEGTHLISLKQETIETKLLFSNLKKLSNGEALQVHLWSCYGGIASNDAVHLSSGSFLVTHSSAEEKSLSWTGVKLGKIITEMENNTHTALPFQSLAKNLALYYSNPFTINNYINGKVYSLYIAPNLISIFKNPEEELNDAVTEVGLYYESLLKNIYDNKKTAYFTHTALDVPHFNIEAREFVLLSNFIYNCAFNNLDILQEITSDEKYTANVASLINKSIDRINPLAAAAIEGYYDIVKLLLDKGADPNIAANKGVTPLYIAAQNGHVNVVELLLKRGANTDFITDEGITPLYIAAQNGHVNVVELLLKSGANVDPITGKGITPLYIAAQNGYVNIVELLLKRGANTNFITDEGITPLYIAAQNGYVNIVELLLKSGANANFITEESTTPLYIAAQNGHENIVRLLLSQGAEVNIITDQNATPLYIAVQNGHESVVRLLLSRGAEVNFADENGFTPLYIASKKGYENIVKLLLEHNAEINSTADNGFTPLYTAVLNGHEGVVKLLLSHNAEVDIAVNQSTPLFLAVLLGYEGIVRLLLEYGAEVDHVLENGTTPLYVASIKGYNSIVKLLLKHGADVNHAANDGITPLMIASMGELYDTVKLLLEYHADPMISDHKGMMPLMTARILGNDKIAKILERAIKQNADKSEHFIEKVSQLYAEEYLEMYEAKGVYSDYECDNDIPIFSYQSKFGSELLICEPCNTFHDEL
ncbi:hypothetical protein I862_06925 [endosymbiont of Acanthamoeba sp. UWC8]|uniref:ankyrin repeat domain-containing protein n=1 Tax=endosymbiont of Acanthamoeba sp. UWC8 TaxID=86106 RepID=UPI0004D0ED41|nr:ankyrin repeat domain-containing protein [endosymbiont of Acanthamoeba sp. UWC8]AIF81939.1 hypothetical protein I862_06925 [endosymbiont of Acanthamoeba sp. UWC8]